MFGLYEHKVDRYEVGANEARQVSCKSYTRLPPTELGSERTTMQSGQYTVGVQAYLRWHSEGELRFWPLSLDSIYTQDNRRPSLVLKFDCATFGIGVVFDAVRKRHQISFAWLPKKFPEPNQADEDWLAAKPHMVSENLGVDEYFACSRKISFRGTWMPADGESAQVKLSLVVAYLSVEIKGAQDNGLKKAVSC